MLPRTIRATQCNGDAPYGGRGEEATVGRLVARLGMMLVMVAGLLALPAAAARSAEADTGAAGAHTVVKIRAKHSGKCLDVEGASRANGAKVIQWDCHGGANQKWRLVRVHGGFLVKSVNSGKCMDVKEGRTASGTPLIQWRCHGGDNQVFKLVGEWHNVKIKARHAGHRKCLDIEGASRANGAKLILFRCHDGDNQRFKVTR